MSWIPVEERLPEDMEYQYYMVQLTDGDIVPAYMYRGKWHNWMGVWISSVVAWQERPAPYVKPRRFVVGRHLYEPDGYLIRDTKVESVTVAPRIPTREAAEKIADIYEEAYRGE